MLSVSKVKINYDKLLARLGYLRAKTKPDKKTIDLIKENLNLAQKIINPKVTIAFDNATILKDTIFFENGYQIKSGDVAKLLKDCFKAYGVCVTIDHELERKRDEFLKQKEIFNAFVLDAAGSVAAEEAIIAANTQIKSCEEKKDNELTKRYSPGYGDWLLKANKDFLAWIGAEQIGVVLNEFYQMKPEKSVSALIGVKKS